MIRYHLYSFSFKKVFKTSFGEFKQRQGIIVSYQENDIIAYGEISPLPGFSAETLEQVKVVLNHNRDILEKSFRLGSEDEIIAILDQIHGFPSLSFGLDTLKNDLDAKRKNLPLKKVLYSDSSPKVACNTTIGIGSESETINLTQDKIKKGFTTFKLKVGLDFDRERNIINTIRKEFPSIKIRLDANQAWSDKEALEHLNSIAQLDIEYCEQPVHKSDLKGLKFLTAHSPIKIAADESLGNKTQIKELITNNCCDIIVIKPALIGLFDSINVTKSLANAHNMEVVFTTLLDGIIGRTITAHLASSLGSKALAHGLDTGAFITEDSTIKEIISNGFYCFSDSGGIGSPFDANYLQSMTEIV